MNEYERMVRKLVHSGPREVKRTLRANLPRTTGKCGSLTLSLDPSKNFTEFHIWKSGRPPEHKATDYLRAYFTGKKITMVDVGANIGIFSLPLAEVVAPGSRFLLVEPNPELLERLYENIAQNDLKGLEVAEVAIGDTPGTARLHFSPNANLGQSRLGKAFKSDAGGIDVPVTTLPDLLAKHGIDAVDLLKVDVEGLEDKVILPALRAESPVPIHRIYFEDSHDNHWQENVTEVLVGQGYAEEERFGGNGLYAARRASI